MKWAKTNLSSAAATVAEITARASEKNVLKSMVCARGYGKVDLVVLEKDGVKGLGLFSFQPV